MEEKQTMDSARRDTPFFSIILPAYNAALYLDYCINSIVRQIENSWELIIVDDGSTDSTLQIAKYWQSIDSRINVISQENAGKSSAMISGFRFAVGRYISIVDSDDWISEDNYSTLKEAATNFGYPNILLCDYIVEPEGLVVNTNYQKNICMSGHDLVASNQIIHTSSDACFSCRMIFQRSFLEENNLLPDKMLTIGEDTDFNLRALAAAKTAVAIPFAGYHYRVNNQNSLTHARYKSTLENDLLHQYKIRSSIFTDLTDYRINLSIFYTHSMVYTVLRNCENSPNGLTYRDIKRVFCSPWLVDSFRFLGWHFYSDTWKERCIYMCMKLRMAGLYWLYQKQKKCRSHGTGSAT